MKALTIVVEGQTEEAFVKSVLGPWLGSRLIRAKPILLGAEGHKGGNVNYARVKSEIVSHLKQDRAAFCSTMFDLYALGRGFPGMSSSADFHGVAKAELLEKALLAAICEATPKARAEVRFIPYLQVHEFEGLLFSDAKALAKILGDDNLLKPLQAIRSAFATPEDINDGPKTAPSKRILKIFPTYKKVLDGTRAAQEIGLQNLRVQCPHFNNWVARLESIATI